LLLYLAAIVLLVDAVNIYLLIDYSDSINPIIEKALEGKRNEIKIKFGIENG
jgi:hypothetical protein